MRKLSRMISPKVRRRTNGCPVAAGGGGGSNSPGMVVALVQSLSDSRRTSFVGSKRPSCFQSPSVSRSTGPYSFSPTRTSHRSAIGRLIAKDRCCHPERKRGTPPKNVGHERHLAQSSSTREVIHRLRGSG